MKKASSKIGLYTIFINVQEPEVNDIRFFFRAPRILRVPETTQPGTLLETFIIKENLAMFRGVHCHLEPLEARLYFDLDPGSQTNVKDLTECQLRLAKKLDYESRSAFIIQIVAEVKYA